MKKKSLYSKFNDKIGKRLSDGLSTMEMFWMVTILVLFPLMFQRPDTLISWVQYLSTAILQAVALPLLGYTTKKGGESQEKVIRETHDLVMKEIKENKKHTQEQFDLMKIITELHANILKIKDLEEEELNKIKNNNA